MVKKAMAPAADAPAEPVIDYADLMAEAASLDGAEALPPGPVAMSGPSPRDLAVQAIVGMLKLPRDIGARKFDWWADYGKVWGDDRLVVIAGALEDARVALGWNIDAMLEKYGPYLALGIAIVPPTYVTWCAIEDEKEKRQAQAAAQRKAPAAPPNGNPQ